ncbi:hypothetical protein [Rosistilla oblonga]|uniref:hypothetical protein n=1 Tax=Rosistilla oblonga TaxID=2527990 RepID=UPI003A96FCAB
MKTATRHRLLYWYLLLFGGVVFSAFFAAAMPKAWMIATAEFFEIDSFPDHRLTWYLARHLSVVYGMLGVAILELARDLPRYRALVLKLGWGIVVLGGLQWWVDLATGMPAIWTYGEAISTAAGGAVIVYLARGSEEPPADVDY